MFNYSLTECLDTVKSWGDKIPDLDYAELAKKDFPDEAFLMEGVEGKYAQEERYGVIVFLHEEYERSKYNA